MIFRHFFYRWIYILMGESCDQNCHKIMVHVDKEGPLPDYSMTIPKINSIPRWWRHCEWYFSYWSREALLEWVTVWWSEYPSKNFLLKTQMCSNAYVKLLSTAQRRRNLIITNTKRYHILNFWLSKRSGNLWQRRLFKKFRFI